MKTSENKTKKHLTRQMIFAIVRAGAALALALALLIGSGFSFVYLLQGAQTVSDGSALSEGDYVSTDIKWIMDVCGEEVSGDKTLYCYAVAPVGNRFVLLRFDRASLADLTALEEETMNYLTGQSKAMSFHLPVKGMVVTAAPGAYSLLSEWFNNNVEWMSITGVVGDEPTAAEYLSNECILVDHLGSWPCSVPGSWGIVMSLAAALLVLYALVEGALMLCGYYSENCVARRMIKKARKEKAAAKAQLEAEKALAKLRAETEAVAQAVEELQKQNEEPAPAAEETAQTAPEVIPDVGTVPVAEEEKPVGESAPAASEEAEKTAPEDKTEEKPTEAAAENVPETSAPAAESEAAAALADGETDG